MVLIPLLDYVDPAHSMDFDWSVFKKVSLSVLICPSKSEKRRYCFSSTDKDESA